MAEQLIPAVGLNSWKTASRGKTGGPAFEHARSSACARLCVCLLLFIYQVYATLWKNARLILFNQRGGKICANSLARGGFRLQPQHLPAMCSPPVSHANPVWPTCQLWPRPCHWLTFYSCFHLPVQVIQCDAPCPLRLMIGLKKVTDLIIAFKLHSMWSCVINVIIILPNAGNTSVDLQPFSRGAATPGGG